MERGAQASHSSTMSDEQLQRGLHASVKIYNFAQEKLQALPEGDEGATCVLSRSELLSMKKASVAMKDRRPSPVTPPPATTSIRLPALSAEAEWAPSILEKRPPTTLRRIRSLRRP